MSVVDDIGRKYGRKKSSRGNWLGKCPAHADKHPSFTYKEEDGKLLLKCWSNGCTFQQIMEQLIADGICSAEWRSKTGASEDGIRVDFAHPEVGSFWAEFDSLDYALIAIYKYHDEEGRFVGFKARFSPKTFRYFTHKGKDQNFAKRAAAIPYRLPQMLKALADGDEVHIFEGEKDCENALAMGMGECVSFGSSGDPEPSEYYSRFKGAHVIVWADNDKPGLKRAATIAQALYNNGAKVRVIIAPVGKDFSDWKEAGATIDEIGKLIAGTPNYMPTAEAVAELAKDGAFPNTPYDLGSEAFAGEYLACKYRSELRYAPGYKSWMHFQKVWRIDGDGIVHEKVKSLRSLLKTDMLKVNELDRRPLAKLSDKVQSDSGRKAVVSTAKTVPSLLLNVDNLDAADSRHLFSCESGVIDLRRGVMLPHSPNHLITKHSGWTADLEGQPQGFLQFVNQLFDDAKVVEWFLNFLGYCMTGETGWQHFCMWVGQPGTGKSQLLAVLRSLLGPHCGDIDSSSLVAAKQRTAAVESDLCSAHGTRLVVVSEVSGQYHLNESVIKALVGEDVLKVKHMGQDKFPLRARAKLVMTANDRPPLTDDGGIARRLLEVRFEKRPEKIVESLGEKLLAAEGAQILGYLAKRARKYYDDPYILTPPDTVRFWTEEYIAEVDYVKQWNDAQLLFMEGAYTPSQRLYESLQNFCRDMGIPMDMNINAVGRRLARLGYKPDRTEGRRGWKHVIIRGE